MLCHLERELTAFPHWKQHDLKGWWQLVTPTSIRTESKGPKTKTLLHRDAFSWHWAPHLARKMGHAAMCGKQSAVSPNDLQPGVAVRHLPCVWMPCLGSLQQARRFYPARVWSPLTTWLGIPGFDGTRITNMVLLSKTGSKGSRGNQRTNHIMVLIFKILPSP